MKKQNRRGLMIAGYFFAGLLALAPKPSMAEMPPPVQINSTGEGQGFLMTRLGKCFAVTAGHVLQGRDLSVKPKSDASICGAGEVTSTGRVRTTTTPNKNAGACGGENQDLYGTGQLIGFDAAADLAVLAVSGPLASRCGLDFVTGFEFSRLQTNATGLLVIADGTGGIIRDQVEIVDVGPDRILIRPAKSSKGISGGWSGSLLEIGGAPAGMLQDVSNKSETKGLGIVRTYDSLMPMIRKMLDAPRPASPPRQTPSQSTSSDLRLNLADAARGARIIRWSAQPTQPEHYAARLITSDDTNFWEAPTRNGSVDVEIELAGSRVHLVSSVEVQRQNLPAANLPSGCEVFVSVDGQSWASVANIELAANATTAQTDFVPRRARFVRLRVYKPNGVVALSRIVIR